MPDLALLVLTLAWGTTFLLVKNALVAGTSPAVLLLHLVGGEPLLALDWLGGGLIRAGRGGGRGGRGTARTGAR